MSLTKAKVGGGGGGGGGGPGIFCPVCLLTHVVSEYPHTHLYRKKRRELEWTSVFKALAAYIILIFTPLPLFTLILPADEKGNTYTMQRRLNQGELYNKLKILLH